MQPFYIITYSSKQSFLCWGIVIKNLLIMIKHKTVNVYDVLGCLRPFTHVMVGWRIAMLMTTIMLNLKCWRLRVYLFVYIISIKVCTVVMSLNTLLPENIKCRIVQMRIYRILFCTCNLNSSDKTNCHQGLLVVISLMFCTPYFYYIPKASLAAVIIAAVVFMVEVRVVKPIYRTKSELLLCLNWKLKKYFCIVTQTIE